MTKKILAPILAVALLFSGCQTIGNFNDNQIVTAVTLATKIGMDQVPAAHKQAVNDILYRVSTNLRQLTSDPTPEQLGNILTDSIPADIRAKYSEALTFVVPLVVSNYKIYYDKFAGNHAKLIQVLNDIATGIQSALVQVRTASVGRCNFVEMTQGEIANQKEFRQYLTEVAKNLDKELAIVSK